jgi:hypothetical protein
MLDKILHHNPFGFHATGNIEGLLQSIKGRWKRGPLVFQETESENPGGFEAEPISRVAPTVHQLAGAMIIEKVLNLDSRACLNLSIGSRKPSRNCLRVVYMYICMSAWRTLQHKLLNLMSGITDLSIGEQNKLETLRGMQKINLVTRGKIALKTPQRHLSFPRISICNKTDPAH